MRRLVIALLLAVLMVALWAPRRARAAPEARPRVGQIDVIDVDGLVDRVVADFVRRAIAGAERGSDVLVIQLNSGGAVLPRAGIEALARRIATARVPVAVWVGPSGARARGGAFALVRAAAISGAAPGTRTGPRGVRAEQAVRDGTVGFLAPTLGDFIVGLDGRVVAGRAPLVTARVVERAGGPRREPTVDVRFAKLGVFARLLHTASSPSVAYLLLLGGSLLVVLELFTAGVGVAAAAGALCLVLAAEGLGNLPVRPLAVVLVAAAVFGFAVDVQAGAPRAWTVIGTAALVVATVLLYHGLHASVLAMAAGVIGTLLFMLGAMPALVRSRFSTPTIGREWMLGERGEAVTDVAPEGTIVLRRAPWRARTSRATPIRAGQPVRVVGIDGILLVVALESVSGEFGHSKG